MLDRLADIFEQQEELQRKLGFDFGAMLEPEKIEYIKEMVIATTDELHEALHEVSWKSWATATYLNRDAYVGELIDALHFLVNLCLVVGVTPLELHARYTAKRQINVQRQIDGYDGVSTKCLTCGRALDDPAVTCTRETCELDSVGR